MAENDPVVPTAAPPAPAPAAPAAPPPIPPKPEGVPDKFYNPATGAINHIEYGKAHAALETQMHQSQPANEAPQITAPPASENATVEQILVDTGLNEEQISQQWTQNGKLSDDQYAALANKGFNKNVVDTHMKAQTALSAFNSQKVQTAVKQAQGLVGGEQQLKNLITWAGSAITDPARLDRINKQLEDPDQLEDAVKLLNAEHAAAVNAGTTQSLVTGDPAAPVNNGVYETLEEQNRAIADERYQPRNPTTGQPNPKHDPAYFNQVNARLRMPKQGSFS